MAARSACSTPTTRSAPASRTGRVRSRSYPARPSTSDCGRSSDGSRALRSDPSGAADRPRRVLYELRVENLLLMERAELRLGEGLNILTGETGAGKTLLAHALDLLLGGKARAGIVRDGASEAYVEGVFALPPGLSP